MVGSECQMTGRTVTRRRISGTLPPPELYAYNVYLPGDDFFVVASCEAMVRLVVIDRRRLHCLPEGPAVIIRAPLTRLM